MKKTKAPDSKNSKRPKIFKRPQTFSLEISWPNVVLVILCKFFVVPGGPDPPDPYWGPGPGASASSASWMIRPCINPQESATKRHLDHSAIIAQHTRVTNTQTDRQTDRHTNHATCKIWSNRLYLCTACMRCGL